MYDIDKEQEKEQKSSSPLSDSPRGLNDLSKTITSLHNNNTSSGTNNNIKNSNGSSSAFNTNNSPANSLHAAGASPANGTAAAGAATGTSTATGASAVAGATGAAGGTAAGAAVGSIVPVAGTAIGAAAGAVTSKTAKKFTEKGADTVGVATATGGSQKPPAQAVDNGTVKIVTIIIAVLVAIFFFLILNAFTVISNLVAPIFFIWEQTQNSMEVSEEFTKEIGQKEPTYEDIVKLVNQKLQKAFETAYYETCYQEVQQIAFENDYDMELTLESYNNAQFPYILSGSECNINYAEILHVISMQPNYDISYTEFNYDEFVKIFNDEDFLRSLYTLNVEPAEKYIPKKSITETGNTCTIDTDGTVTIQYNDGTTTTITGEEADSYYETIVYGKVSISHYSLKHIFDCFGIDPYAKSKVIPSVTNFEALDYHEYYTRHYYPNEYWGSTERTELLDYQKNTGQLSEDLMNIYIQDISKQPLVNDNDVFMDVEIFKQSGQSWSHESYGESGDSIAKIGCCLTSMSMVCNYFSNEYVTPHVLNAYIKETNDGLLNRASVAKHYGFKQCTSIFKINIVEMMNELSQGRLIIVHIRSGAKGTGEYGHWVVLNGFHVTDTDSYFYVCEPASRLNNTVSMSEAVMIFDQYQTYGVK